MATPPEPPTTPPQPFYILPHPAFAEDQRHSKTILTTHVLHRGFQTGALLGLTYGSLRAALNARKARLPATTATTAAAPLPRAGTTILRGIGYGALAGTGAMAVALTARMWGREEIEWQDRSWRLQENTGQMEVDDWGAVAGVGGAALAGARAPRGEAVGLMRIVGGVGAGGLVGVAGYMARRYAVNGGRR